MLLKPSSTPRGYSDQIIQLKSREERNAALQEVPEAWRDLVMTNVLLAWNHPKGGRK